MSSDYGRLPTLYARATKFMVDELMRRGMTREAAEQQALEMVLAQAVEMKAALDGDGEKGAVGMSDFTADDLAVVARWLEARKQELEMDTWGSVHSDPKSVIRDDSWAFVAGMGLWVVRHWEYELQAQQAALHADAAQDAP